MGSRLTIVVVHVGSGSAVQWNAAEADAFEWLWVEPGDDLRQVLNANLPAVLICTPDALRAIDLADLYAATAGTGVPVLVDAVPFSENTWSSLRALSDGSDADAAATLVRPREKMPEVQTGASLNAFEQLLVKYEYQSRLFDYIASTTPDFIYIFNLQGQFIYANRGLLTTWGRELEDCVGKTCLELGYEKWHHDMHMREIAQVIETKRPIRGEVPFRSQATGTYGVYEYIFTPVISPEGKVEAVAGTTRDVTERKEMTESLRHSKQLMELALSASRTGTFRWDPTSGDFLAMDQTFREIFAVPDGVEIKTAEDVFSRIHPDDLPAVVEAVEGVRRGKEFVIEFRIVRPDGSVTWVLDRARASYDGDGDLVDVIGACTDITKLKETQEELRAAERHREFVMESMPQKIFLADSEGQVYYFNRVWVEYSGLELNQLVDWHGFIHPADLPATLKAWETSISTGTSYNVEHRLLAVDGSYRWHVTRAMAMRDDSGNVQLWIGSCTDVDDMKVAQQALEEREDRLATLNLELQKARDEALAASAAKSMFLASMSHELRTPLNAIIGYSEMLRDEVTEAGNDPMVSDLNKILLSGKHLLAVISDILDISKIEAGKMEFELEAFDVKTVVEEAITLVAPLVEKNANELEVVCGSGNPLMITSDRVRIRQVLFNLLSNAAKFTENGVIRVTCTGGMSSAGVAYVELAVSDSGIGIPEEKLVHIFKDFSQLELGKNRVFEGAGLGLAISRRLCQLLGGEIQVQSEEGRGSVFTVRLPVVNDWRQCRLGQQREQQDDPARA